MSNHSSQTPHKIKSTNNTFTDALKRRAESLINDNSIDAETRALIRYGMEIDDPWLAELVRRADAGENIVHMLTACQSTEEKIEALAEILCRAGDEFAAALLVLMATLENAEHPKALANMAKHLAFTRCGELNLNGMVDAQIAVLEGKLLTDNTIAA